MYIMDNKAGRMQRVPARIWRGQSAYWNEGTFHTWNKEMMALLCVEIDKSVNFYLWTKTHWSVIIGYHKELIEKCGLNTKYCTSWILNKQ